MRSARRTRIGRYRVEWDSEHLQVTMPGSRWRDALLLGGLGGGFGSLFAIFALYLGWRDQWWLYAANIVICVGGFGSWGYSIGKACEGFAIEAFLTGERAVWVRLPNGIPRMVPFEEVLAFETVEFRMGDSRAYGVELKTRNESIGLLPGDMAVSKPFCDVLSALLNALVLKKGSANEALARAGNVRRVERRVLVVTLVLLAALLAWLVYFFVKTKSRVI